MSCGRRSRLSFCCLSETLLVAKLGLRTPDLEGLQTSVHFQVSWLGFVVKCMTVVGVLVALNVDLCVSMSAVVCVCTRLSCRDYKLISNHCESNNISCIATVCGKYFFDYEAALSTGNSIYHKYNDK